MKKRVSSSSFSKTLGSSKRGFGGGSGMVLSEASSASTRSFRSSMTMMPSASSPGRPSARLSGRDPPSDAAAPPSCDRLSCELCPLLDSPARSRGPGSGVARRWPASRSAGGGWAAAATGKGTTCGDWARGLASAFFSAPSAAACATSMASCCWRRARSMASCLRFASSSCRRRSVSTCILRCSSLTRLSSSALRFFSASALRASSFFFASSFSASSFSLRSFSSSFSFLVCFSRSSPALSWSSSSKRSAS
mmetsp:Transcript_24226/g.50631  ORF Transcript_24226/g.50631 Transcript_24226/m.50631 type:complete len:251 (+) Transcript_24226:335-1087(+)